ncbi:MAG: glyoxalase [Verrucomicrobiaceae bacterium]|nr:MAG: glyoxalase [Verrucomicrobiaceae bacterium]
MSRIFDHIDLRVPDLAAVTPFYQALLPALGFTRRMPVDDWLQYEDPMEVAGGFFGITESRGHVANENRIAFRADSVEQVEALAEVAVKAGARNVEGPMLYDQGYHAVFFEDPAGNRLEICYRIDGAR